MLIQELAQLAGVPAKTIRYYETIGLLPAPHRGPNNYRMYSARDVDRLRLIAGSRSVGLPLVDVAEIQRARDSGEAPCGHVLAALARHLSDVDHRIADLLSLRTTLAELLAEGVTLPQDDVLGEQCICALLKAYPTFHDASHQPEEQSRG
ncbi:MAG: MerR family DNA-binding transcriptional regulator [Herpetosiphonaceae bacterium]|nr:MerR family DNA-binding transcriptional regulator [Herpetosiphonaceae bacterium]